MCARHARITCSPDSRHIQSIFKQQPAADVQCTRELRAFFPCAACGGTAVAVVRVHIAVAQEARHRSSTMKIKNIGTQKNRTENKSEC